MSTLTFYQVLGVSANCSADDVRRAYYQAARKHHPDKHLNSSDAVHSAHSKQYFLRVQEAYETLRDSTLRQQYDMALHHDIVYASKCTEVVVSDEILMSGMRRVVLHGEDCDEHEIIYTHQCRCGDFYEITANELLDGVDVVACTGCSQHIRVLQGTLQ